MTETHWADYADARYYDTRELVSSRHSPTPYSAPAMLEQNLEPPPHILAGGRRKRC